MAFYVTHQLPVLQLSLFPPKKKVMFTGLPARPLDHY